LKKIYIPLPATTYRKNASYNFVEFLMNRAGRSMCGGRMKLIIDYLLLIIARGSRANAKSFDSTALYVIASEAKQSLMLGVEIASSLRSSQ